MNCWRAFRGGLTLDYASGEELPVLRVGLPSFD
jgi:hypothetical protein